MVKEQKIIKVVWKQMPPTLIDFLAKNIEDTDLIFKAMHYWALCRLKRVESHINAYGTVKRKLSTFSKSLYRQVRNFAISIASELKRAFPSKAKKRKMQQKFLHFLAKH